MNTPWMPIAKKYTGQSEIHGVNTNPTIASFWKRIFMRVSGYSTGNKGGNEYRQYAAGTVANTEAAGGHGHNFSGTTETGGGTAPETRVKNMACHFIMRYDYL